MYSFTLFVVEDGENSRRAHENLKRLCEKWLPDEYNISKVDVVKDFQKALDYNILVTPSVVKTSPEPEVTIHGDLSDSQKFLDALNIERDQQDDN